MNETQTAVNFSREMFTVLRISEAGQGEDAQADLWGKEKHHLEFKTYKKQSLFSNNQKTGRGYKSR